MVKLLLDHDQEIEITEDVIFDLEHISFHLFSMMKHLLERRKTFPSTVMVENVIQKYNGMRVAFPFEDSGLMYPLVFNPRV